MFKIVFFAYENVFSPLLEQDVNVLSGLSRRLFVRVEHAVRQCAHVVS